MVWEVTKNLQVMECKWTVATSYKPGGGGWGSDIDSSATDWSEMASWANSIWWDTAMHRLVRFSSPLVSKANELLILVCNAYYA